jgi:predicted transcriptional regulator
MNEVKLHVESLTAFRSRSMEMARKLDRGDRRKARAHISFESMEALLRVLTPNRWALLRALRGAGPSSIRALAKALARDYRGVHADVTALIDAGLIARDGKGAISVPWSRITAEMALDIAA